MNLTAGPDCGTTPMGITTTEEQRHWSNAAYLTTGIVMTAIGVTATVGNGSILCMFFINRALVSPTNVLIIALCLSDLLICICGLPLGAAANYSGAWIFGETGCIWYGFANLFFGLASLNTLCGIAIARYLTVVPQKSDFVFNKRKAVWLILIGWSWALIWSVLPLTGWTKYTLEGAQTSCSILWGSDEPKVLSYVICLFLFGFVLPTLSMSYCYVGIYLSTRTCTGRCRLNSGAQRKIYRRQRRVLRLILSLTVTYFISWTPYTVVALMSTVGNRGYLSVAAVELPSTFAKSGVVWNPIVYVLINSKLRKTYLKTFQPFCKRSALKLPNLGQFTNSESQKQCVK